MDAEDYLNDKDKFNVTCRLVLLSPSASPSPLTARRNLDFVVFGTNSTRAFALKLDVFLLVRKTCALTMNVKDWLLIAFSWSVIKDTVTPVNLIRSGRSQSSLILCLALFTEGSPLDLLTDELRKTSIRRIISDYFDFIDNFNETSLVACPSGLFGIPVFILSASLQSLQVGLPDIDARTLKFLVSITINYRSSVDNVIKDQCLRLFSETLGIISDLKHLYASNDIEQAIMEIVNIFMSEPPANMDKCKPNLAHFVAGLIHMEISESDDDDAKSCAAWGLYHFLLKERQWALSHLAITAFGYFAARTKCNQLWRFVPQDAALSYDLVSGVEANKDRFMSEFRTFLNKEIALLTVAPNPEQLELLAREGLKLKQMVHKISAIAEERHGFESMEIDDKNQSNKKSKLPDGISRGVELLKSGLKIIGDGLSQWQIKSGLKIIGDGLSQWQIKSGLKIIGDGSSQVYDSILST